MSTAGPDGKRYVLAPTGSVAAQQAPAAAASYTYQQGAPSVIESVIMSIVNPGVNRNTVLVLNVTLVALVLVIGGMLLLLDFLDANARKQLWVFLAITAALILSVNWL